MRLSLHPLLIAPIFLVRTSWALHESDVGIVDWHKHLVGVPLAQSLATAPIFHHVEGRSLILSVSGNNVLSAIEQTNGTIAWRHIYEMDDRIVGFYKDEKTVAMLSGPGGSTLRTFEAATGALVLEKRMHDPKEGHLSEPFQLGKAVTFSSNTPDIYVLTNGNTINYINGETGEVKWTWASPDQSSLVIYSKLIISQETLYAIGMAKSISSFTIHITSFSATTGEVIASSNVPSSLKDPLNEVTTLSHQNMTGRRVVWLEESTIKSILLRPDLKARPIKATNAVYAQLLDVGLGAYGQLVGIKTDGAGRVIKLVEGDNGVQSVWEFEDSATSENNAASIFAGGLDKEGFPYIARVYWSHVLKKGTADVFASHLGTTGQGMSSSFQFQFDSEVHGVIGHVALEVTSPSEPHLVVSTTTGAVQLWKQNELKWTREEGLAATVVAEFIELPEKVVSSSRVGEGDESFFVRLNRQMSDARNLPKFISNFATRFVTGSYASASSSVVASTHGEALFRDPFGFRQVIVAATMFGKMYGIDSSNGNILWSRILGLGWAGQVGGAVHPVKIFATKTVSDGGHPEVVLVAQRKADNSLVDTVLFHVDALTGEDVTGKSKNDDVLEGHDIILGPLVDAYLLQTEPKTLVLLDEFLQVYLYPDTEQNQKIFTKLAPSLSIPLKTSAAGLPHRISGHQFIINKELSDRFVAYPTWTLSLPPDEDIQAVIPQTRGPVASIGRVLGDRSTLYKYLNQRLFIVHTTPTVTPSTRCGIYLVDSMKGTIVYRAAVPPNGNVCDVKSSLAENWLVYHYYEPDASVVGSSKGYRMVSVEFYEGHSPDQKTESSDMSSFSNDSISLTTYTQSYVFPHGITAMATTATKFGITSKDLIVATKNNRIQSFPRRLLDPRRPTGKPTAADAEEMLIQYDPIMPDDARRVLSHNYEVANTQRIVTAPALLESTSLVLTYGLDMFLSRVAPSNTFDVLNENFNKLQLVLTVSGLLLAIIITKPMVERKRLREKWYN